jgi:hypothetical protein
MTISQNMPRMTEENKTPLSEETVAAEIRTKYLLNTTTKSYHCTSLLRQEVINTAKRSQCVKHKHTNTSGRRLLRYDAV